VFCHFFFYRSAVHRDLHSFPTRRSSDLTVAVLPSGTGCDLIRTFGIPQDLAGAAKHLTTNETYRVDLVAIEGGWGSRHYVNVARSEEHTSELQSRENLVCRLLLEKKKKQ